MSSIFKKIQKKIKLNKWWNSSMESLPGTQYSKFLMPLDYMPSRNLSPRWGYGRPNIKIIDDLFSSNMDLYQSILDEIKENIRFLENIPKKLKEKNLPSPAWFGVPFTCFDLITIYTMVARLKPKRYVEIGSGISTAFSYKAIKDNHLQTTITSIDPEPRANIDSICDHVIREGLETCDLSLFETLEKGDTVFVDGSHRSFMNSDVTVFMIDILPNLKPGVIVHMHDILLPSDYAEGFKHWYWNEQYLVAVYLIAARDKVDILFPTYFVSQNPAFSSFFEKPLIDFSKKNGTWKSGGSLWFSTKGLGA